MEKCRFLPSQIARETAGRAWRWSVRRGPFFDRALSAERRSKMLL